MKRNINKIMNLAEQLSAAEQKDLIEQIMKMVTGNKNTNSCGSMVERFINGTPDCPHCHASASLGNVIKKGKNRNGAQRYYCKECNRFFTPTTNTAFSYTRKDADLWRKYIELTITGKSLKDCAVECKIAYQTAFTWRHKILNAFYTNQNSTMMAGNVEVDEMLIPISYKGNHFKGGFGKRAKEDCLETSLPREALKRGTDNKSTSSKDKACVFCMVQDGNRGFYAAVPGVGFMSNKMLNSTIGKHVDREKSLVIADNYRITKKYLENRNYNHQILSSNTSDNPHDHKPEVKDGLHMQHVNAMHRHIRRFLSGYCGVSSKYLENYISLYVWIQSVKAKRTRQKLKDVSVGRAAASGTYVTRCEIESRPAVPCCA